MVTGPPGPEPAVAAGEDLRSYSRLLSAVYDATMSGSRAPARPREVIGESWRRLRAAGFDPEHPREVPPLPADELERLRHESGLHTVLDTLARGLAPDAAGEGILVVGDSRGRVLWRRGPAAVLAQADRMGFVEGASWAERSVGTNAIGTALLSRRPVQIFSAEHYVRSHHRWTCAGSPIRDPRTGRVLGVVDLSGPISSAHPTNLMLVDVVARLAESQLREQHRESIDRLRVLTAPMLARLPGPAMAVDPAGWVAAVQAVAPQQRVLLPEQLSAGNVWLPALGPCAVESLPGGWLLRPLDTDPRDGNRAGAAAELDLRTPAQPMLRLRGPCGDWTHQLTPRHAEILYVLAVNRAGLTAGGLVRELFGGDGRTITVRAEMSRLRRHLGGVIAAQPYRFDDGVTVELRIPDDRSQLMPHSSAPAIIRARDG